MIPSQSTSTSNLLLVITLIWVIASTFILYTRNLQQETKIRLLEEEYKSSSQGYADMLNKITTYKRENFDVFYKNIKTRTKLLRNTARKLLQHVTEQNDQLKNSKSTIGLKVGGTMQRLWNRLQVGSSDIIPKRPEIDTFALERRISKLGERVISATDRLRQIKFCRPKGSWRDFRKDPIMIITPGVGVDSRDQVTASQGVKCDVPCFYAGSSSMNDIKSDGFMLMGQRKKLCPYQKNIHLTMENVGTVGYDVVMDTRLDSEVTAGYYSWVGFDFMKKSVPKTQKALASAFISNCGASSGRDQIIKDLKKFGVTVDGFGRCFPDSPHLDENKPTRMAKYKFHLAFENSVTNDYVTEKYFQSIETGTLGVYLGAPNIEIYEPQKNAVLRVKDFPNTEALAKEMLRLANNTKDYDKYFEWKTKGPSDSFKAVVDISAAHSYCRVCIHLADRYMKEHGKHFTHDTDLLVRERNTFWYKPVHLEDYNVDGLHTAISEAFKEHVPVWANQRPGFVKGELKIYRITPPPKNMKEGLLGFAYDTDEKVSTLKPGSRLEVIFI